MRTWPQDLKFGWRMLLRKPLLTVGISLSLALGKYSASAYADFTDLRARTNVFEDLAAFTDISTTLRSENQSDRVFGLMVSENYFDLLGVKVILLAIATFWDQKPFRE